MKEWPRLRETPWLQDWLQQPEAALYWRDIFDRVSAGKIDTWDYQWLFACWVRGGLAVTPETNLVTNIGFGEGSTHTTSVDEFAANLPLEAAGFPLNHPRAIERQSEADDFESEFIFRCSESDTGLYARARRRLSRFAGRARTITD